MSRRARRPRTWRLALAVPALLLAAGCATPPAGVARTEVWSIPDTGMTLAPPGAVSPTISSAAAYAQCLTGAAGCASGPPTRIELTMVTDTGTNMIDPDGSVVWAIEWIAIPCPLGRGGGLHIPGSSEPTPTPQPTPQPLCDEIALVDARSGSFVYTYTGPHS